TYRMTRVAFGTAESHVLTLYHHKLPLERSAELEYDMVYPIVLSSSCGLTQCFVKVARLEVPFFNLIELFMRNTLVFLVCQLDVTFFRYKAFIRLKTSFSSICPA